MKPNMAVIMQAKGIDARRTSSRIMLLTVTTFVDCEVTRMFHHYPYLELNIPLCPQ